jgi:hypothetical protein
MGKMEDQQTGVVGRFECAPTRPLTPVSFLSIKFHAKPLEYLFECVSVWIDRAIRGVGVKNVDSLLTSAQAGR